MASAAKKDLLRWVTLANWSSRFLMPPPRRIVIVLDIGDLSCAKLCTV